MIELNRGVKFRLNPMSDLGKFSLVYPFRLPSSSDSLFMPIGAGPTSRRDGFHGDMVYRGKNPTLFSAGDINSGQRVLSGHLFDRAVHGMSSLLA